MAAESMAARNAAISMACRSTSAGSGRLRESDNRTATTTTISTKSTVAAMRCGRDILNHSPIVAIVYLQQRGYVEQEYGGNEQRTHPLD